MEFSSWNDPFKSTNDGVYTLGSDIDNRALLNMRSLTIIRLPNFLDIEFVLLASPGCYENPVPLQDQLEADTGSCSGEYEDTDFIFRERKELGSKDWDLLFTIHSGWLVRLIQLAFKATFDFQLFRCNSGFDTGLILRFYYDVTIL